MQGTRWDDGGTYVKEVVWAWGEETGRGGAKDFDREAAGEELGSTVSALVSTGLDRVDAHTYLDHAWHADPSVGNGLYGNTAMVLSGDSLPAPGAGARKEHQRWRLLLGHKAVAGFAAAVAFVIGFMIRGQIGVPLAGHLQGAGGVQPASRAETSALQASRAPSEQTDLTDGPGLGGTNDGGQGNGAQGGVGLSVVVDVHGDVHWPGVYRLPMGSRVQDAVRAAGGYLHPEDAGAVNAAAPLDDGAEVVIPGPENPSGNPSSAPDPGGVPTPSGDGAVTGTGGPAGSNPVTRIDLNAADLATLETLPDIGPARAAAILAYRAAHGRFANVAELRNVRGIGPTIYAQISPYLYVDEQRNSASQEDANPQNSSPQAGGRTR